jgi:hypothetical protein
MSHIVAPTCNFVELFGSFHNFTEILEDWRNKIVVSKEVVCLCYITQPTYTPTNP